jgi:NAD(P)-dependent dehydrogenase (short-subunit alcohol dehydrogenase family)
VELVFNNAGLMSKYFVDYTSNTLEDFHQAMAVNFYAPIQIAYHFLPKMIQNGFGRMQLTTSGIANEPELAAYACAKAALTKFVKDFACKLNGTDVMMNVMDPGWLRTDLGGPKAPNAVESVIPGALVGVLLEDKKSGRWFSAQDYVDMDVEAAVKKAESVA